MTNTNTKTKPAATRAQASNPDLQCKTETSSKVEPWANATMETILKDLSLGSQSTENIVSYVLEHSNDIKAQRKALGEQVASEAEILFYTVKRDYISKGKQSSDFWFNFFKVNDWSYTGPFQGETVTIKRKEKCPFASVSQYRSIVSALESEGLAMETESYKDARKWYTEYKKDAQQIRKETVFKVLGDIFKEEKKADKGKPTQFLNDLEELIKKYS